MFNINLEQLLLSVPPILISLTVHEAAHAYTAMRFGDPTAAMLGRVTLNPIKHLDPIGTLMIFFSGFIGWAKPVPVNPRLMGHPSRDLMLVSLAGPASNIMLACVGIIVFRAVMFIPGVTGVMPGEVSFQLISMLQMLVFINVSLAVFNMLPIHPLDGSKILEHFLPYSAASTFSRIEPYGMFILIAVVVSGVTSYISAPFYKITLYLLYSGTGGV
ncbi:MAG: site-2 protease family protein [Deltaproteobacteria bacterium]|nr:site-2 protease family protein [Deltaproteobacteria bacterium]